MSSTTRLGGRPGRYVGALDQGTTSSRFIIFDRAGSVVAVVKVVASFRSVKSR